MNPSSAAKADINNTTITLWWNPRWHSKGTYLTLIGFAQCVNKNSLSERRKNDRAEQTDLLYANAKEFKVGDFRLEQSPYL